MGCQWGDNEASNRVSMGGVNGVSNGAGMGSQWGLQQGLNGVSTGDSMGLQWEILWGWNGVSMGQQWGLQWVSI